MLKPFAWALISDHELHPAWESVQVFTRASSNYWHNQNLNSQMKDMI